MRQDHSERNGHKPIQLFLSFRKRWTANPASRVGDCKCNLSSKVASIATIKQPILLSPNTNECNANQWVCICQQGFLSFHSADGGNDAINPQWKSGSEKLYNEININLGNSGS